MANEKNESQHRELSDREIDEFLETAEPSKPSLAAYDSQLAEALRVTASMYDKWGWSHSAKSVRQLAARYEKAAQAKVSPK